MTLSPVLSRLLAVVLLAAVGWLAWVAAAAPLLDGLSQDRESIARSRQLMARYGQFAALIPDLQTRLAALRAAGADRKTFLESASPALMTAELQASAQRLAKAADVGLRSSRTLPAATEDGFQQIGLDLDLTASAAALQHLLYDLETAEPVILVKRLSVRVPENGATAKAADGQPGLNITLEVVSYAPPDRTSP